MKDLASFARFALGALAIVSACQSRKAPVANTLTWEDLPAPSWRIVARRGEKVLLVANRVIAQPYRTLIFEQGRVRDGPAGLADAVVLRAPEATDTLHLYSIQVEGRRVLFTQTGEGPTPHESPAEPGLYVVEHRDNLWLLSDSGAIQLTADSAAGIARDTLRSQTAEGGPLLYWANRPLWKPDGSAIAFVTNRTWMLAREGGQEVWLVEPRSRMERPLLSERGKFFSPDGWLGSELVFSTRSSGIFAVNPHSNGRRQIAGGAVVAFSLRGSRLFYATFVGDTVRGQILTERGTVTIPDPPPGERFSLGGAFSPGGDRLVLETTFARDSGMTRALYVFELGAQRLTPITSWSFREAGRHPQGFPVWLDDSTLLLTQFDRATGLESSTIVRLPSLR